MKPRMYCLSRLFNTKVRPGHSFRSASSGVNDWKSEISVPLKLKIESYWKNRIKQPENKNGNKYIVLSMFPYPSGKLHMGHVRIYTISDTVARYNRMKGHNVIHPMGWDAFGLPAENAAIEHNIAPNKWTQENIVTMKGQLEHLGCSFDWSRELATCNPDYYKWTQYLFLKLYSSGLAYQKEAVVNWDPVDQTVLADEQVDTNGCSWRSGAKVERRRLKQWFIRTTRFAKSLFDGLNDPILEDWRDIVKLQKHWIGECTGVIFDFKLSNNKIISFWTQYPEFIESGAFIAVSPKSQLGEDISDTNTRKLIETVINPFTNTELPIFITNEIDYAAGTDCHLGIPFISESDTEFSRKYGIPYSDPKIIPSNETEKLEIQQKICKRARDLNIGGDWTSSKLHDWLISRQRFWGTPIPIIHCKKCGPQPVSEHQLPVQLPDLNQLSRKGLSPLLEAHDWLNTTCPQCNDSATRETDTMDTFVDSSWYFLRYLDPKNLIEPFCRNKVMELAPVDLYIGGKEHAVLHLYYARFIHHFLHSLSLVPEREPFKRLLVQGMVMGRTYRIKGSGKYLQENEVEIVDLKKGKATDRSTKQPVVVTWEKMSKSKLNGVDPEYMFKEYSVDTTRLLIMADVAPTSQRNWTTATFPGILNWQKRLWLTLTDFLEYRSNLSNIDKNSIEFQNQEDKLYDARNYYVKGASFNYFSSQQFSVAISKMQGLTNSIRQSTPDIMAHGRQYERALAALIMLLAPMAPHFASEMWAGFTSAPNRINVDSKEINWNRPVLEQTWPDVDLDYKCSLQIKVNGADNSVYKIPRVELDQLTYKKAVELAVAEQSVQDVLDNRKINKALFQLHKGISAEIHIFTERKHREKDINI